MHRPIPGCFLLIVVGIGVVALVNCIGLLGGRRTPTSWAVVISAGAALGLAAVLILRAMRRERRRLSAYDADLRGICGGCGYDLRATPGRCPECGRFVGDDPPQ